MPEWKRRIYEMKGPQWILLGAGLGSGAAALIIGISDNPPGIALLYFALVCLAAAWVWTWRSQRKFWYLLLISLAVFPVGAALHNFMYMLGVLIGDIPGLRVVVGFFEVLFFLVAVIAAAPVGLVALIGGIVASWKGMGRLTALNRSVRRFKEGYGVKEKTLLKLVNLARQSASSANLQPLKYMLSFTPEMNQRIFPALSWAGYLKEWAGPEPGERPSAYILLLGDRELANSFQYDAGIASQSITLGATERGLGACLVGSIKKDALRSELDIPDRFEILLVIAIGKPQEMVVLEDMKENGEVKYWRDEMGRHHVPKRGLEEIVIPAGK